MATILSSVFGGVAFAQERRERSADFLAMLPITRGKIVTIDQIADPERLRQLDVAILEV